MPELKAGKLTGSNRRIEGLLERVLGFVTPSAAGKP